MKNKLIESWEKLMLRKRSLIETVNDQLKISRKFLIRAIVASLILWSM